MVSRLSAFVIWALVAAATVFWSLRLLASPLQAPPQATTVSTAVTPRGDLARLLGAQPVAEAAAPAMPDAAARFKLLGVVAPRNPQAPGAQGVALLSIDGKPPRAFRVGAALDGDWRLQEVAARGVTLAGPGGTPIRLELPPLPVAATGQLPPVSFSAEQPAPPTGGAPAVAPAMAPPPPVATLPAGGDAQAAAAAAAQVPQGAPSQAVPGQVPAPPPATYVPPQPGGFPPTAR